MFALIVVSVGTSIWYTFKSNNLFERFLRTSKRMELLRLCVGSVLFFFNIQIQIQYEIYPQEPHPLFPHCLQHPSDDSHRLLHLLRLRSKHATATHYRLSLNSLYNHIRHGSLLQLQRAYTRQNSYYCPCHRSNHDHCWWNTNSKQYKRHYEHFTHCYPNRWCHHIWY